MTRYIEQVYEDTPYLCSTQEVIKDRKNMFTSPSMFFNINLINKDKIIEITQLGKIIASEFLTTQSANILDYDKNIDRYSKCTELILMNLYVSFRCDKNLRFSMDSNFKYLYPLCKENTWVFTIERCKDIFKVMEKFRYIQVYKGFRANNGFKTGRQTIIKLTDYSYLKEIFKDKGWWFKIGSFSNHPIILRDKNKRVIPYPKSTWEERRFKKESGIIVNKLNKFHKKTRMTCHIPINKLDQFLGEKLIIYMCKYLSNDRIQIIPKEEDVPIIESETKSKNVISTINNILYNNNQMNEYKKLNIKNDDNSIDVIINNILEEINKSKKRVDIKTYSQYTNVSNTLNSPFIHNPYIVNNINYINNFNNVDIKTYSQYTNVSSVSSVLNSYLSNNKDNINKDNNINNSKDNINKWYKDVKYLLSARVLYSINYTLKSSKWLELLQASGFTDSIDFLINHKATYRIFNEHYKSNGRFYGGIYQYLNKELRKYIKLDNEEIVELDYSGLHLRMLYHTLKIDFRGDPYTTPSGKGREHMKKIALIAINSSDKEQCIFAIISYFRRMGNLVNYQGAEKLLNVFIQNHKPIEQFFYSSKWRALCYADSTIMNNILIALMKQNIVAYPIHDSIIVKKRHEDILREIMQIKYKDQFGFYPVV